MEGPKETQVRPGRCPGGEGVRPVGPTPTECRTDADVLDKQLLFSGESCAQHALTHASSTEPALRATAIFA